LKLEGKESNAVGIGARIKIVLKGLAGDKDRSISRTVSTGGSFGANPLRQHIGLGTATNISHLEVHWPASGKTQNFTNIAPNRLYVVAENEESLREMPYSPEPFRKDAPAKKHLHTRVN
jgi:hypothetical protein